MHEKLIDFQATKQYLPGKLNYMPITEDISGPFTVSGNVDGDDETSREVDSTKWLMSLTDAYVDMEELVRKNWLFSEEKIKGFMETNPVQKGLRAQVESLCIDLQELQTKFDAQY